MRHEPKAYRALALDGGGIRGLYTATVLDEIGSFFALHRRDSDLDLGRRFDLISGTSTGGILACGLAAGISISKIIRLYEEFGPKIFTNPLPANGLAKLGWLRRSATKAANKAEPLKQGLLEIFGGRTIGSMFAERGIALCIPSIKMLNQTPKVFKTNHCSHYVIDKNYSIVDVCLATSAAPVFLPLHELDDPVRPGHRLVFADGGLWANNPTLVAFLEALEICFRAEHDGQERRPIEILSIGTCSLPDGDAPDAKTDRGLLDWLIGIKTTGLAMNAQAAAAAYMATLLSHRISELGRSVRVVRIENPAVSANQAKHLQLDLATPQAMELLKQLGFEKAQTVMSQSRDGNSADGQFIHRIFTQ